MENYSSPKYTISRMTRFFFQARAACEYSDNKRTRVGAVLVYKNKVVAMGRNYQDKTSPLQKRLNYFRPYDPNASGAINSLHAEVACIKSAEGLDIDWSKASIFVYRMLKDDSRALAKPCPACMQLIKEKGIKHIYYSTANGWEGIELS